MVSRSPKSAGDTSRALAEAPKKHSATYEISYMKHAPLGPTMATADVKSDGTVTVHRHNQNPQALRGQLALMLGVSSDKVIVKTYSGPRHYGRSNGGNAGAGGSGGNGGGGDNEEGGNDKEGGDNEDGNSSNATVAMRRRRA